MSDLNEEDKLSFKKLSDDDTYLLRDLKIAGEQKIIWDYLEKLGIPDDGKTKYAVYAYYRRKTESVPNTAVFYCRENYQPSRWYFKLNETLPKRIHYIPKHPISELPYLETVGIRKLNELQKDYTLPILSRMYNLNPLQVKNVLYKRYNSITKRKCYKILPPEEIIVNLKSVINPDYWFIFTDEIQ